MKLLTPPPTPEPPMKTLRIKIEYCEDDIEASTGGSYPEVHISAEACQVLDEDATLDQIRDVALDASFKLFARLEKNIAPEVA